MKTEVFSRSCGRYVFVAIFFALVAFCLPRSAQVHSGDTQSLRNLAGQDPTVYDSRKSTWPVSFPFGTSRRAIPTSVAISLEFSVYSRPAPGESAVLISTFSDSSRGIKLTMDMYGNVFVQFGIPSDGSQRIDAALVASEVIPDTWHTISLEVDLRSVVLDMDNQAVRLTSIFSGRDIDAGQIWPEVQSIELGQVQDHQLFDGRVRYVNVETRLDDRIFDLFGLRFGMILISLAYTVILIVTMAYSRIESL